MIVRTWHGRVPRTKADDYAAFLTERAASDYQSIDGLHRLEFSRKDGSEVSDFLLITYWASMEAVRAFAGDRPELAKYYPEDDDYLLEKEPAAHLYQIFHDSHRNTDKETTWKHQAKCQPAARVRPGLGALKLLSRCKPGHPIRDETALWR